MRYVPMLIEWSTGSYRIHWIWGLLLVWLFEVCVHVCDCLSPIRIAMSPRAGVCFAQPRFLYCGLEPGTEKLGPVPLSQWRGRKRLQLHPTGDSVDYISFPRRPPRSVAVWHHKASTVLRHRLPARQETPVKGPGSTNHTIKPASLLHSHTPYTSTNQITKNIILRPTSHKNVFFKCSIGVTAVPPLLTNGKWTSPPREPGCGWGSTQQGPLARLWIWTCHSGAGTSKNAPDFSEPKCPHWLVGQHNTFPLLGELNKLNAR